MSDDEQLEALQQRARAALDSESFDEALQFYLEAAKLTPEQAWPWVYAAHCHEELGNLDEALDKLRKAEAIAPSNWKTQRYIGRVLQELGRSVEAEAPLRRAAENDPAAISLIYLFSVLSRLGRDEEAEEAVRQALVVEPGNDEAHYNLGVSLRFRKEYINAEVHFRRAVELDSNYMVAYAELGFVLQATGRNEEAVEASLKAVDLDPNYYWARLYLASAYYALDAHDQAEFQYKEAIRIDDEVAIGLALYGDFLGSRTDDRQKAESNLRRAVELEPSGVTRYYLGKHLLRWGREKDAREQLAAAASDGHEKARILLVNGDQNRPLVTPLDTRK